MQSKLTFPNTMCKRLTMMPCSVWLKDRPRSKQARQRADSPPSDAADHDADVANSVPSLTNASQRGFGSYVDASHECMCTYLVRRNHSTSTARAHGLSRSGVEDSDSEPLPSVRSGECLTSHLRVMY